MTQLPRLALALAVAASATGAHAADARHPVVVELFESQGCSSCPPANANVAAISDHADVLALNFGVTYWDDLGWKDTFAKPAYTARQWDYAHGLGHRNVYTPQVVVNGRIDGVGADPRELAQLVHNGERAPSGPDVTIEGGVAKLGAGVAPKRGADVWLVRYDPRVIPVAIRRGENGGKTLPHKNVVKELVRLGSWTGQAATLRLPPASDPALKTAVFVQLPKGGPILAAARS